MKTLTLVTLLLLCGNAMAWEGQDWQTGNMVTIEGGNHVRKGFQLFVKYLPIVARLYTL